MLAGTDTRRIVAAARVMMARTREWPNPYGDGRSGEAILDCLVEDGAVTHRLPVPIEATVLHDELTGEQPL